MIVCVTGVVLKRSQRLRQRLEVTAKDVTIRMRAEISGELRAKKTLYALGLACIVLCVPWSMKTVRICRLEAKYPTQVQPCFLKRTIAHQIYRAAFPNPRTEKAHRLSSCCMGVDPGHRVVGGVVRVAGEDFDCV